MYFAFIAIGVLLLPLPTLNAFGTSQPSQSYVVSGSVVGKDGTWTHTFPAVQVSTDVMVLTTVSIRMSSHVSPSGVSPNCLVLAPISPDYCGGGCTSNCQVTASGREEVRWVSVWNSGTTFMDTVSILQVNYYPYGTITGAGPCNSYECSGGYVANGYALCSGPQDLVAGAQSTIAYSQTNQGGAAGFLADHGIASYPEVQYNSITNVWTYRNPDSSGWTFGGVQCTGWSFSFPSP